jgi:hypothetical protein
MTRAIVMQDGREHDISDHVHPSAVDHGAICPTVDFNYDFDQPGAESTVPISVACSALSEIVDWTTKPTTLNMISARSLVLKAWLNPVDSRYRSLNAIADECGVSRASLSKSLLSFRDQFSIGLTIGRLQSSREIFRQAQIASVEAGRHASRLTRKIPKGDHEMNYSEAVRAFPTLDKAADQIVKLTNQLEEMHQSTFKAATAAPTPRPAPAPRPSPKPARPSVPVPPARVEDLDDETLKAALDLSNHAGNTEMVATLYSELVSRRAKH